MVIVYLPEWPQTAVGELLDGEVPLSLHLAAVRSCTLWESVTERGYLNYYPLITLRISTRTLLPCSVLARGVAALEIHVRALLSRPRRTLRPRQALHPKGGAFGTDSLPAVGARTAGRVPRAPRHAGVTPLAPRLDQRLEPRDAAADDAEVRLNSDPHPQMRPLPSHIVRLTEHDVEVMDADRSRDDHAQAHAEERDEGEPLGEREASAIDGR